MSEESNTTQGKKLDLISSITKPPANASETNKQANDNDSWDDAYSDNDEDNEEENVPKINITSQSSQDKVKISGLKDIFNSENKKDERYKQKKNKSYNNSYKKNQNYQTGEKVNNQGFNPSGAGGYNKRNYYNSQKTNQMERVSNNFSNSNTYYSNKSNNQGQTGFLTERQSFTNTQPRKQIDIKVDSSLLATIDQENKPQSQSDITNKIKIASEIFKKTNQENEGLTPVANREVDLGLTYSTPKTSRNENEGQNNHGNRYSQHGNQGHHNNYNSHNSQNNYNNQRRYNNKADYEERPAYFNNKRTFNERPPQVKESLQPEEEELQKPHFENKHHKEGESNFVEIHQEGDLFYKKLKEKASEDTTQRISKPKEEKEKRVIPNINSKPNIEEPARPHFSNSTKEHDLQSQSKNNSNPSNKSAEEVVERPTKPVNEANSLSETTIQNLGGDYVEEKKHHSNENHSVKTEGNEGRYHYGKNFQKNNYNNKHSSTYNSTKKHRGSYEYPYEDIMTRALRSDINKVKEKETTETEQQLSVDEKDNRENFQQDSNDFRDRALTEADAYDERNDFNKENRDSYGRYPNQGKFHSGGKSKYKKPYYSSNYYKKSEKGDYDENYDYENDFFSKALNDPNQPSRKEGGDSYGGPSSYYNSTSNNQIDSLNKQISSSSVHSRTSVGSKNAKAEFTQPKGNLKLLLG